ncbi:DOPA 4,5-dioxygenase family protein [Variovorax saccharolyticus]|uniref:DOPA 4,5-dioxygenase family protein n=1 Tax=Variovorax saccharolyticus TaxID=3053516 RepID=UPI00257746FB|nr:MULTISPECIES: DOPA 4,5-dioxygenase family protein [unclassified Variovorax]MDM0016217.1 DOPA 4,5-dioxygenase family protein [Variovorax sp. J22R187]MDM0027148.1 DOPA 4,5-dioxygenase family protein [Variovorax sp. J31P216]
MPRRPENLYPQYHAHLYFGPDTLAQARRIAEEAGRELLVVVGRVHEKPVGPHPRWSCQIAFDAAEFDEVIAWLEAHRGGLDVFVHGLTGDDYKDHTAHAMWLGNEWPLELGMFQRPAQ